MSNDYAWLTAGPELDAQLQYWLNLDFVVLDTEFIRTRTFYPIPGLIQIADDQQTWFLDPQVKGYEPAIKTLLESDRVIKVLHACSEDLEVFTHAMNASCRNLFDTQIASALLGEGMSLGYAALVEKWLGLDLDKSETRSDWLQRPLTDSQLFYAQQDVRLLHQIYPQIQSALLKTGRMEWVLEDSARMADASTQEVPQSYYLKIRQAWQLKGRKLWLLRALAAWREELARDQNIARPRLIKDMQLFQIAERMPANVSRLKQIKDLPPALMSHYGGHIVDMVEASGSVDHQDFPERIQPPLKKEATGLFRHARDVLNSEAEILGIPAATLVRKKDLELMINHGFVSGEFILPDIFEGWRRPVGDKLLKKLNDFMHLQTEEPIQ